MSPWDRFNAVMYANDWRRGYRRAGVREWEKGDLAVHVDERGRLWTAARQHGPRDYSMVVDWDGHEAPVGRDWPERLAEQVQQWATASTTRRTTPRSNGSHEVANDSKSDAS